MTLALDSHTSALWSACWTSRLLSSWTGAVLRVRRLSDDAEQDFTDAADIAAWCGSATGVVVRLYDQTGNSRDLYYAGSTHATTAPIIWTGSALHSVGDAAAFRFANGGNQCLLHMSERFDPTTAEMFTLLKTDADPTTGGYGAFCYWGDHSFDTHYTWGDNVIYEGFGSSARKTCGNPTTLLNTPHILNILSAPSDWRIFIGDEALYSTGTNTVAWRAGAQWIGAGSVSYQFRAVCAGLVLYTAAKSSRSDIRAALRAVSTQYAEPAGWIATGWGDTTISNGTRTIQVAGQPNDAYGTTWASWLHREINAAGAGIDAAAVGTPAASDSPRWLYQRIVSTTQFGTADLGTTRWRAAQGFEATQFGTTDAWDKRQPAAVQPWASEQHGIQAIALFDRPLVPTYFPLQQDELLFGGPRLKNQRHIIEQAFVVGPYDGGVFGDYHHIKNRNTTYPMQGWHSLGMGKPTEVRLAGPAVQFATLGEPQTLFAPLTFIAPKHRSMTAQGWESNRHPDYTSLRNSAYAPQPTPWSATEWGGTSIKRGMERVWPASIGTTSAVGGAEWVSRSPRTIDADTRGIWAQQFGQIRTGPKYQYIGSPPAPDSSPVFGSFTQVFERFNIIAHILPSDDATVSSGARLHNVTPEVTPVLFEPTEFGTQFIRTQFRELGGAGGLLATQFQAYKPFVEFKTRNIRVDGWESFATRDRHIVELATPNAPQDQYVVRPAIGALVDPTDSASDLLHATQFGPLTIREQQIEPGAIDSLQMGVGARIATNTIRPVMISPDPEQVGYPRLPVVQRVNTESFDADESGIARMSPWYIWAPRGYTLGGDLGEYIDEVYTSRDQGPIWGGGRIQLSRRYITPSDPLDQERMTEFGSATAALKTQFARTSSFSATRFGIARLPGEQIVEGESFDSDAFGDATAQTDGTSFLRVAGLDATQFGTLERVHLFTRTIEAQPLADGINDGTALFGQQSIAREFDPFRMTGFEATEWGSGTFIDYRIRSRQFEGWDAEEMEYTGGAFHKRMRIYLYPEPVRGPQPIGFESLMVGGPATGLKYRTLQASQFASFRPGYPRLAPLQSLTGAGGSAHTEWGDPDRVIEGTIRPRMGETAEIGRVTTQMRFTASAGDQSSVTTATVSWLLSASGWGANEWGEAAALQTYGHNCGRTPRAMRPEDWAPTEFGGASVA